MNDLDTPIKETCAKCMGTGTVSWGVNVDGSVNGRRIPKVCFDCNGRGYTTTTQRKLNRREADRARRAAKAEAEAAAHIADRAAKRAEWDAANPGLADRINANTHNRVLASIAQHLAEGGTPTPASTAAAITALDQAENDTPAPRGRHQIEGTILSFKAQDSRYGTTIKMLLDCGTYRLWGTVPTALEDAEVGDRVAFTATITPAETGFGFYARPTKARKA